MKYDYLTNELTDWYKMAQERDRLAIQHSESILGAEMAVFVQGMGLSRTLLDFVLHGEGQVHDEALKAKMGVADRMFLLLWASWHDTLTGRYTAAAEHWRSLLEAPNFLLAFTWDPSLAERWIKGDDVKFEKVRKAIRNALKDEGSSDFAREWDQRHLRDDRAVQAFSHTSTKAIYSMLATATDERGNLGYQLRSELSVDRTRELCIFLAKDAWELARACGAAFSDNTKVAELWGGPGKILLEENIGRLTDALSELEAPSAAVKS
jgi:hypothetical protein